MRVRNSSPPLAASTSISPWNLPRPWTCAVISQRPVRFRRTSARTPRGPFASRERSDLSQVSDGFLVRLEPISPGMGFGKLFQPSGVRRQESARAASWHFAQASSNVAFSSRGFVVNPALRVVHHRLRFLGRQPMPRAEILDDGSSLQWRYGDVVLADHAFDCVLPAFRRGARPGNALQISLLVGGVARATFGQHQGVGDGDADFGLALREQRHRRNQQDSRGLRRAGPD